MPAIDEKLVEIQILLMDQQQTIDDLNNQLCLHDQKLAGFKKKLTFLEHKINQLLTINNEDDSGRFSTEDDKPPHY